MATMELARYRIDPSRAQELEARWQPAVTAIRDRFPGLIAARLIRLDESTFVDAWEWETLEAALTAAEGALSVPEAAALFELIVEPPTMEHGEILRHA